MKKKVLYNIMLAASLFFGACSKDFLDQKPYSALPIGEAINNETDLQTAVNGMYAAMKATTESTTTTSRPYMSFTRHIGVLGDLLADNVYISSNNSGRYLTADAFSFTVASAEPEGIWNSLYQTILRANTVINANLPESATVKQLKGEALTIRALCYHELVKHFATPYTVNPDAPGVPVVTTFDQNALPSRATVSEVYAQINADLGQAFDWLSVAKNSSYVNKYAAKALQARVYLFMGNYASARDAALAVVNGGGYTLVTAANYVNYWKSAAPRTDKVETIFEISYDATNNAGTTALAYIYDQAGYGQNLATSDLYSKYGTGDVRKDVIIVGARKPEALSYIVNKYPNSSNTDRDEIKVIRYAEVLLTLAESYARTGNDLLALSRLNEVATTRGATTYTSGGAQLIEDVILERRKELAFEGHRYWDLIRLNRDIVRTNQQSSEARLIPVGDFRRILPIPQYERDANPNIVQNEGYIKK